MPDNTQFTVHRSTNKIARSQERGSNATHVIGISSADITCACGNNWTATESNGLRPVVGGVHVQCPSCGAGEVMHMRMLQAGN